jgi:DNA-binding response OmpR family regulator
MLDVWVLGVDNSRAAQVTSVVGQLGFTPRRVISCPAGRPVFADGGAPRRPEVVVAVTSPEDSSVEDVCSLLALHAGLAAPIVVVAEEDHLPRLPDSLVDHELIVHPFSSAELRGRIRRARLRFSGLQDDEVIRIGNVTVNLSTYSVTIDNCQVNFSNLEYQLLKFLLMHPQRVLSREALLHGVWGYNYYGGARTVDVHIRRLRAKLGPGSAEQIKTVRGIGYRFQPV